MGIEDNFGIGFSLDMAVEGHLLEGERERERKRMHKLGGRKAE